MPVRRLQPRKTDTRRLNDIQRQRQLCHIALKAPSRREPCPGFIRALFQGQGDIVFLGVAVVSENINHKSNLAGRSAGNRETRPLRRNGNPARIARGQRQPYPSRRSDRGSSACQIQTQFQGSQPGAFYQPFRITIIEGNLATGIAVIVNDVESVGGRANLPPRSGKVCAFGEGELHLLEAFLHFVIGDCEIEYRLVLARTECRRGVCRDDRNIIAVHSRILQGEIDGEIRRRIGGQVQHHREDSRVLAHFTR